MEVALREALGINNFPPAKRFLSTSSWFASISFKERGGHRCTVVGNPGGVLGFFWQILLRGVLRVVRKSGWGSCYIAFLYRSFSKIFIGGTWGAPLPPLPPVCIYGGGGKNVKWDIIKKAKMITSSKLLLQLPMADHFVKKYLKRLYRT